MLAARGSLPLFPGVALGEGAPVSPDNGVAGVSVGAAPEGDTGDRLLLLPVPFGDAGCLR